MPRSRFPGEVKRGPLKGRHFDTQEEYDLALAEATTGGEDSTPAPKAPRQRSAGKVTQEMAAGLVSLANMALAVIPATRADQLDEVEQKALVLAILNTAKTNRAFANVIVKICSAQSNAQLASTVGAIVAVRLARHGRIPAEIELPASFLIYTLANEALPTPTPAESNGYADTPFVGSPVAEVG